MKKMMMILGIAALLTSCNKGGVDKNAKLSTEADSVSYSVGVLMSSDLKNMPFVDSLNKDLILSGIMAGLEKDGSSQLSAEEAMRVWRSFGMKYQEKQMKKAKEEMAKTKEKGKKFLEENKVKAGVITTESGLQYQIEKQGEGKLAKKGEIAVVNYTGTLIDGTEFDSSLKEGGKPFEFPVGEGRVIKGWDDPAGSTLIFDVELLEVKPAPKSNKK